MRLNAAATSGQRAEFAEFVPSCRHCRWRSGVTSNAQSGGGARLRWPSVTHAPLTGLRVTHFGHFDPGYSRNRIVAKALRRAGAEVRVVSDPRPYARRTPALLRRALGEATDLVLVGFPGHADVVAAKAVARLRGAPVLFDAFVSLQETAEDRRGARRLDQVAAARPRGPIGVPIGGPGAGRHRCSRRALRDGARHTSVQAPPPVGRCRRRRDAAPTGSGPRRLPRVRVRQLHPAARARARRASGGDPRTTR